MRQNRNKDIVFKTMAYLKANIDKALSVPEIAKGTGFSERHIRSAFKAVLNQSLVSILQSERIKKAKALLRETNLDIGDVGFEAGFENHARFARVFHEKVGLTPSEFRKRAVGLKEIPPERPRKGDLFAESTVEIHQECFPGTQLGPNWKAMQGAWRNDHGKMLGAGSENHVAFVSPLPENCRIAMQIFIDPIPDLSDPDIAVNLYDEQQKIPYCSFSVASGDRPAGELRHYGERRKRNAESRIRKGEWHELTLEIMDDALRFFLDEREVFSFRDSFPPPYSARCYLHLETWHCSVQVRQFAVRDLGYLTAAHPIKQGDALYNAGLYAKAGDFYMRFLRSGSACDVETMELRYKIGMCALRQKFFSSAQSWIDKVVGLKDEKFWAEQAGLALLEIHWRNLDLARFQEHMELCIEDKRTLDSARVTIQLATEDLFLRGFVEESSRILEKWRDLEERDDVTRRTIQGVLADVYLKARKFDKTEGILVDLIRSAQSAHVRREAQVNLMQLYLEWGKIGESEQIRMEIEEGATDSFTRARCTLQRAIVLRAQEKMDAAVDLFLSIKKMFPLEDILAAHAKIQASHILCCLGKYTQAQELFNEAKIESPHFSIRIKHTVPLFVMTGNFLEGGQALLEAYGRSKDDVALVAETGVKAGILQELAGLTGEARSMFENVSMRFPEGRVRFYGAFASALAYESAFDAGEMPYEHQKRSEMFYLLGLLMEKRGDERAARVLFEKCIKEDQTLRWPTFLAKNKFHNN